MKARNRWTRPQPESGGMVVHFNEAAPAHVVCEAFDTVCGVSSGLLDRWVTCFWEDVTCQRCLRHKARRERIPPSRPL
jgi:hypothetical protein